MISYRKVVFNIRKIKKIKLGKFYKPFLVLVVAVFAFLSSILAFNLYYWGKILPSVRVAGIDMSGQSPQQAEDLLKSQLKIPNSLHLTSDNQTFTIPYKDIDLEYNWRDSVIAAYNTKRTGNTYYDISGRISLAMGNPINLGLKFTYDEEKLDNYLSVIAGQAATEPVYPSVTISDGEVAVDKGLTGKDVNIDSLKLGVLKSLAFNNQESISIPTKIVDPTISDKEVEEIQKQTANLIDKSITLTFEYYSKILSDSDIAELISINNDHQNQNLGNLIENVKSDIEREPQNSVFEFVDGKVKEFVPSKDGVTVKDDELKKMILEEITALETSDKKSVTIQIPVETVSPQVTNEEVNSLGIKELIGRGTSRFVGSISSRIYNIGLAASRINGTLIGPGETVSFNNIVGDVSTLTGYKQAYVIQDGKTVLGDGGGVCQVSTTLFRAALDAGFPIIERRAHSYRVGYYEQDAGPGLDATVYAPYTDLKFKNDSPGHILIQTQFDAKKATLAFEIYGTSDGRIVTMTKPVVTSVTPPPEDLYIDDPTLPAGTIKQIDYKAWGAKANFNYKVERNGKVIFEKTFYSNFQPWQAKFLRGTGPVG
jgi:vancomycin resistance protein YoaR